MNGRYVILRRRCSDRAGRRGVRGITVEDKSLLIGRLGGLESRLHDLHPEVRLMDASDIAMIAAGLAELPDREAYRRAAHQELLRLIPADDALWVQAENGRGTGCLVWNGDPFLRNEQLGTRLADSWTRHVTPRWQSAHPYERTPFRVSDVIAPRRWREDEVFRSLRDEMPEHQLTITAPPPARYRGWIIVRRSRDFSAREVEMASGLAPVLAALGSMYDRLDSTGAIRGRSHHEAGLTARELCVLTVLAEGLTAGAIGRRLGISERTVGKHLQNLYRKLGCNDRLIAVSVACELGLVVCPQPRSSGGVDSVRPPSDLGPTIRRRVPPSSRSSSDRNTRSGRITPSRRS